MKLTRSTKIDCVRLDGLAARCICVAFSAMTSWPLKPASFTLARASSQIPRNANSGIVTTCLRRNPCCLTLAGGDCIGGTFGIPVIFESDTSSVSLSMAFSGTITCHKSVRTGAAADLQFQEISAASGGSAPQNKLSLREPTEVSAY